MEMKWKIRDLLGGVKNAFFAIIKGELLLRLKISRWFLHIAYTFFLLAMLIWTSLMIETTLNKVEKNKKTLRELEIIHSQRTYELVSLSRRSTVDRMLTDMGSKVGEPDRPATRLEK